MDILNFISWIKGGRRFTSINPDKTLLPIGVKDARRDDSYLAGAISATDFVNQLSPIEIPKLVVRTTRQDVQVNLDFYQNTEWQKYNPKIFLFRIKSAKRKKTGLTIKYKGSGFVHPTDLNSTNSKFWGGSSKYSDSSGAGTILRHTEFELPTNVPYSKFIMSDLGLDKYEWVNYIYEDIAPCVTRIKILYETSFGPEEVDVSPNGYINNKPYYNFVIEGIDYRLYWDPVANWVATPVTLIGSGQFDVISNITNDCPYSNPGVYTPVNQTGTVTFINFAVNTTTAILKRQSVAADYADYSAFQIGGDGEGKGYGLSMSSRKGGGWREFNCPNLCFAGAYNDRNLSNQKIKFKLAIVIDNPNATPENPYLIGPMSDTFVLRFGQNPGHPLGFTNDYISGILMT
jgi:hypothetical protein